MILIDYSSIIHRMIYSSVAELKPKVINGKVNTNDFIGMTKHLILQELFSINQEFSQKYGELVICLDKSDGGYWRKEVFPKYKQNRKRNREDSEIVYEEVFLHLDELTRQIKNNLPWKVVEVSHAEADDIMLVLAREYSTYEEILIHSPDKDMLQAQRFPNVSQYSSMTKKWITPENKYENMEEWIQIHVCLGDSSDGIPRVTDSTEFSKYFISHLEKNGIHDIKTPMDFMNSDISREDKTKLLESFDVYKLNRKKESTGVKHLYNDMKLGPKTLKEQIVKHGSLDNWLDSHPLYRRNYQRNFQLIMSEGIPSDIWNKIVLSYKNASTEYNSKEFEEYLTQNNLRSVLLELPSVFKSKGGLTAEDFSW